MANNSLTLILDLGTHKCRAVVMRPDGSVAARHTSRTYPTHRDQPGWAEQEPQDWWNAALSCIHGALKTVTPTDIAVIVPVGHGPSHLPIDETSNPLGRALIWQDTRARAEADFISSTTTTDQRFHTLDLHLPIAPAMGPAKLLWLRDHQPERYERAVALIQPKDYLTLKLTNEVVSDRYGMKDLVNASTGEFDAWYADTLGLRRSLIPRMLMPWSIAGATSTKQETETNLPAGIPVVCGTIDAFSGLIGSGGQENGDVCDVGGTSEIIGLMRHAAARPFEGFLCYPLEREISLAFAVTRASGDSIDWFIRNIAKADDIGAWIEAFEARHAAPNRHGSPVLFWPYLDGERSPIWNADARGSFYGIDLSTDLDALARAVMEGVAFSIRHNLDLLEERTGTKPAQMWVGGGTARIRMLNRLKADITGLDVLVPDEYEGTARGAAAMAQVALGHSPDVLTAVRGLVGNVERIRPNADLHAHYESILPIYRELAVEMQPFHARLAEARRTAVTHM